MLLTWMFVIYYLVDPYNMTMITYKSKDNVLLFTWNVHTITVPSILNFDKPVENKKCNFLMMTRSDRVLDAEVRESECFYPVVIKGLFSAINEGVAIPTEVEEILGDFCQLISEDLPDNLPPVTDIIKLT